MTAIPKHTQILQAAAQKAQGAMPPLLLEAERVAASVLQGVHGRRRPGDGESFWQFRDYQPGDPPGRIDWRQSAKRDRALVREMEWEASQSLSFWCDGSASMKFSSHTNLETKAHQAQVITLALSTLALKAQEQVGLLGDKIKPTSNRRVLDRMAEYLVQPDTGHSLSNLPPILGLKRYSQTIWISDFFENIDEVRKALLVFANKGIKGLLIEVHDPSEEDFGFEGRVRFADSETGTRWILSDVEDVRDDYQKKLRDHQALLVKEVKAIGWSLLTHRTDQPVDRAVSKAFQILSSHHKSHRC
jgi:uncharacterized protein (DUF58 family)